MGSFPGAFSLFSITLSVPLPQVSLIWDAQLPGPSV